MPHAGQAGRTFPPTSRSPSAWPQFEQ